MNSSPREGDPRSPNSAGIVGKRGGHGEKSGRDDGVELELRMHTFWRQFSVNSLSGLPKIIELPLLFKLEHAAARRNSEIRLPKTEVLESC